MLLERAMANYVASPWLCLTEKYDFHEANKSQSGSIIHAKGMTLALFSQPSKCPRMVPSLDVERQVVFHISLLNVGSRSGRGWRGSFGPRSSFLQLSPHPGQGSAHLHHKHTEAPCNFSQKRMSDAPYLADP